MLLRKVGKYWNPDWTARPDGTVIVTDRRLRFEVEGTTYTFTFLRNARQVVTAIESALAAPTPRTEA